MIEHQEKFEARGWATDWWRPIPGESKPCWVCGEPTEYAYLDIGHQHPDCDAYPDEDGDTKIINGKYVIKNGRKLT